MIPRLAFGTGTSWWVGKNDQPSNRALVDSIKTALKLGFRHIDTAEVYGTEADVGIAIREFLAESGLRREDLYIATKVGPGIADIEKACRASLARLGLAYVDLYYIHSPFFNTSYKYSGSLRDAWHSMEKLVAAGLTKQIAVSNFRTTDLDQILPHAQIKPVLNQIEFHPYLQQPELASYCKSHGIELASYAGLLPLTHAQGGPVDAVVSRLAAQYKKSSTQILLRWNMHKVAVTVTTSSKEHRLQEMLAMESETSTFDLTPEDIKAINGAGAQHTARQYWVQQYANNSH